MPSIEISQETFDSLQRLAIPLLDTPDSVIKKLIASSRGLEEGESRPTKAGGAGARSPRIKRARHGERTPAEAFYGPIVKVLRDAGGELRTAEVVDQVERFVEDELTEVDYEPLESSGELRWRNTCRWARKHLVDQGKLDPLAPHGVWRLASTTKDRG